MIETDCYSDEEIAEWDEADKLTHAERLRILDKLGQRNEAGSRHNRLWPGSLAE